MATVTEKNHDSSTTIGDHYSTVTDPDGGLSVIAGAALNSSTYGVRADYDAGTNLMILKNAISGFSGTDFAWRLMVKFDNLANSSGVATIGIFSLEKAATSVDSFNITLRWNGTSTIEAAAAYLSDALGTTATSYYSIPTSGEVCLEIRAVKETGDGNNDGTLDFYVDSTLKETISDCDNWNNFNDIDQMYHGFSSNIGTISGTYDFDEWILDDDSTADLGCSSVTVSQFRFLGMDADTATLMVSGLKDGTTLRLYDYDLAALGENGTAEFGSATDTELDNRTRGIFPVSKPMEDDVWYLYGRDGNNVQVQYNNRNGTLGWTDLGPGTATWGTAKYAVALMPSPTRSDDVIVAFADADMYRTRYGTMTWVLMGTADTGLRTAARQIANRFNEVLTAGTAAGTLEYSPNFGATFGDVSGTALGTINSIEVSL